MTPAQTRANGFGTPSLPQLWLTAALRVLAELMSGVASTLRMRWLHLSRDWHTHETDAAPPAGTNDIIQKEALAAPHSSTQLALMVSSTRSVRPSNHEGVLTSRAIPTKSFSGLSRESRLARHRDYQLNVPLFPAKAGTQGGTRGLLRIEASIPFKTHNRSWIPAFAGMSGDGSVRKSAPA